ncbi:MAG: hypothetical protein KIT72_01965 [Polyangiaceae bacterium]|nr:hypothetical protein [Polyangiaceae bacterium]MCW5789164.1 hypothetical protein [Polyangiaceae bacterium]
MRRVSLSAGLLLPVGLVGLVGLSVGCGTKASSSPSESSGGSSGSANGGSSNGGSAATGGAAGSANGGSAGVHSSGGSAGTDSSGGAGGSGHGGSGNGGSGGTIVDAGIPDVTFEYDAPIIVPDACAGETIKAEPIPVDMYIVLDDSGSMSAAQSGIGVVCPIASLPGDNSRWCKSINALWGFINAPSSSDLGVALNYFNNRAGTACTNPLRSPGVNYGVGLATISPAHIGTLRASLDTAYPGGQGWTGTPTRPAVDGIISYTNSIVSSGARPGRKQVGVLITDGEPSCGGADIGNVTRTHFTNTGIPTFMIGMTGLTTVGWNNLEAWANGSGAPLHSSYCGNGASSCYHYSVGNGDATVFINVLQEIQRAAIACTLNIPTSSSGGLLDPSTIEVTYTPGGSATPQTLTRVANAAACSGLPGTGEFYYDDNTLPTQINLCPNLCDVVKLDHDAEINVEISCQGS